MKTRAIMVFLGLLGGVLPAQATIVVTGALTKELEVTPGETSQGTIEVFNPDHSPQDVRVYQTDYSCYSDGRILYGEPGTLPRSNARWTALGTSQVTIPPGETVPILFTVTVPNVRSLKGTYWSVIMVEPVLEAATPLNTEDPSVPQIQLRQVFRYAVQVVTTLADTGRAELKFLGLRVETSPSQTLLHADVENVGERWLRGTLRVEVYNTSGALVGKFDGGQKRILPGSSVRFSTNFPGLRRADYRALVVVDCGGDDVFGTQVKLDLW